MGNGAGMTVTGCSPAEFAELVSPQCHKPNGHGGEWALCPNPSHDDHDPSLWIDRKNGKLLFKCWGGCSNATVIAALQGRGLWPKHENGNGNGAGRGERRRQARADRKLGRIVKIYSYTDEHGNELYQVVRFDPKDFRQRRRCSDCGGDGCGNCKGGWIRNLKGVRRVPYHLAEIIKSAAPLPGKPVKGILVVEGERDVETLEPYNFIVTTNSEGAEKWHEDFNPYFNGRAAVIIPDNDQKGERHALIVARNLKEHASEIKIVRLPGLPEKGDVTDWVESRKAAGDTPRQIHDALVKLIETTPVWQDETHVAAVPGQEVQAPAWSEDAIALRFVSEHGADLRYVAGEWRRFAGVHWARDLTQHVRNLVRRLCRQVAREAYLDTDGEGGPKVAKALASKRIVDAVESLASADPRVVARAEDFDQRNFDLGTPDGPIDLESGILREPRREDYLSKCTAVAPSQYADCPMWLGFLDRIMRGDDQMVGFLKRMIGYCLTGETREQVLFFWHGSGQNGKGVCMNTVKRILGDYATSTQIETLTVGRGDRHPTEIAGLKGARLVVTTETSDGRLKESLIKQLTGSDPVKARFMHKDEFEYYPNFKLVLSGNRQPRLRNVDKAIKRRLFVIPFTVQIPDEEVDKRLEEKLRSEWPAILRWAIEGCMEWQRDGLRPPAAVRFSTDDFFENADSVGRWVSEHCESATDAWTLSKDLYASWKSWAEANGEYVGTLQGLVQELKVRGFQKKRGSTGRMGFQALRVVEGGAKDVTPAGVIAECAMLGIPLRTEGVDLVVPKNLPSRLMKELDTYQNEIREILTNKGEHYVTTS